MRLDKFLAGASIGTRKAVRHYIYKGTVTVNNQVVLEPSADIKVESDVIHYLGKEINGIQKKYYMFYKPEGCITARKDANQKTVLDYFILENTNGIFPVGRLDKDTEGLLLLTNDGEFNHRLMYPDKHIEKTYFFWAFGSLNDEKLKRLETGIQIRQEEAYTKAARIEVIQEGSYQELKEKMQVEVSKDIKKNPYHQPVVSGYLTITEGRKHQVKRMLKAVGCCVVYLKRISIGSLILDESLEKGQYRELDANEIRRLYHLES